MTWAEVKGVTDDAERELQVEARRQRLRQV